MPKSLATNYHANIGKWLLLALISTWRPGLYLWRKQNLVGAMLHADKELRRRCLITRRHPVAWPPPWCFCAAGLCLRVAGLPQSVEPWTGFGLLTTAPVLVDHRG
jgi:hypothetical protein